MNFDKPFWKNVLRESDGTPSSSRLFVCGIVFSSIFWVTYLVRVNKVLPDLAPVGAFITSTALALYGVNKLSGVATNILGKTGDKETP